MFRRCSSDQVRPFPLLLLSLRLSAILFPTSMHHGLRIAQMLTSIHVSRSSGGLVSDLWDADTRGVAMAVFSLMPSAGPAVAPVISGYMSVAGVNWRVIFWLLFGTFPLLAFLLRPSQVAHFAFFHPLRSQASPEHASSLWSSWYRKPTFLTSSFKKRGG